MDWVTMLVTFGTGLVVALGTLVTERTRGTPDARHDPRFLPSIVGVAIGVPALGARPPRPVVDEVITHQDVLDGLSPDVQEALTLALPPELRGWWTEDEITDRRCDWIDVTDLGSARRQYVPGGWRA